MLLHLNFTLFGIAACPIMEVSGKNYVFIEPYVPVLEISIVGQTFT